MAEQLTTTAEKAEGYRAMQETFRVTPYEFKQLRDTTSQYELKLEMWTKLDNWNESLYGWRSADFKTLEVEEMIKEVAIHYKDVHKMAKRPGPDGIRRRGCSLMSLSRRRFRRRSCRYCGRYRRRRDTSCFCLGDLCSRPGSKPGRT